jgi:hypothetical protein
LAGVGVAGLEVIVVDDGSTDATAAVVESVEGVILVRHSANRGYGAALKTGFSRASGALLAFLDADSTYPPESLVDLCDVALREDADVVIGSRRSGGRNGMPPLRRLGNLIWSGLLSLLGSANVQDPASGMRVVRRRCLESLYPLPDGLHFTPVMSTRALHEGLKVIEIPIPYHERSGRSKLNVVRDGFRFLQTIVWTVFQYNPAAVLELAGCGALATAAALGLTLIMLRLSGVTELGPWGVFAVYSGLVCAVGGVSGALLGMSFNQLVALFHAKPVRQVNLFRLYTGISPERHFGWLGVATMIVGLAVGCISLALGVRGWEITRLWLWLVGSALLLLLGMQMTLFWMLMQVLATLSQREERVKADLLATLPPSGQPPVPVAH